MHSAAFGVNSLQLLRLVKQATHLPTAGRMHFLVLAEVLHDRECLEKDLLLDVWLRAEEVEIHGAPQRGFTKCSEGLQRDVAVGLRSDQRCPRRNEPERLQVEGHPPPRSSRTAHRATS